MQVPAPEQLARRWHQEIYLRGRLDVADQICAADMVAHGAGVPADAARGPEYVRQDAAAIRAAFSIDALTDDDIVAAGDKVAIRWSFRGTHVGEIFGVPATGRRISFEGLDLFRIANGKIQEFWSAYDTLSLAHQVGAINDQED
jgi:predicted ester cyclase